MVFTPAALSGKTGCRKTLFQSRRDGWNLPRIESWVLLRRLHEDEGVDNAGCGLRLQAGSE